MLEVIKPLLFAILIWWFSTGVIILLDRKAHASFRFSLLLTGALAIGGLWCLPHVSRVSTTASAYGAFMCTLLIWAWIELSFLTGLITGPIKRALPTDMKGSKRFVFAACALLYHEIVILFAGAAIALITLGQPNQTALWTFAVLWIMRTSAKLNLFLGVRNLGIEFLPDHLKYLASFFRFKPMNWLFPISMTLSCTVMIVLFMRAFKPGTPDGAATGMLLVAALLTLAIIEHLFMVLPIRSSALWAWAMPNVGTRKPT